MQCTIWQIRAIGKDITPLYLPPEALVPTETVKVLKHALGTAHVQRLNQLEK